MDITTKTEDDYLAEAKEALDRAQNAALSFEENARKFKELYEKIMSRP